MQALAGAAPRATFPQVSLVVAASSLVAITAVVLADLPVQLAPIAALAPMATLAHRSLLAWRSLVAGLLLVILAIPIRRYTVPGNLPFQLEPYRLYVLLLAAAWGSALLVDPRVRARTSGLEGPLLLFGVAAMGSILVNAGRIQELALTTEVLKKLTFFGSFVLVFYVVVSVVRSARDVDLMVKLLVAGGAALGFLGMIEARTGYNPFDHLAGAFPFLQLTDSLGTLERGGRVRAYGSAQHPIAFGALLTMLIPLAIYVARRARHRGWWGAVVLLALGSLASVSRTSIVMLLVIAAIFLRVRSTEVKRLWPAVLPILIAVHLVLPGTIGTIKASFFPEGGLIAQQSNADAGSARVSSFGPAIEQAAEHPVVGLGFGTRIVEGPNQNAFILDDQWLSTLLEVGVLGVAAWMWLFLRFSRRLGREALRDTGDRGWLLAGITAAVSAYALSMFFFDAFSFIQVTILMFVLLGLGSAALRVTSDAFDRAR